MKLGFIGAGKVAQAMAQGIINAGEITAKNIIASAPRSKIDNIFLEHIAKNGIKTTHSNSEVVKFADIVILAVKPNVMPIILPEIAPEVSKKNLILSFALGVTLRNIEKALPMHTRVARVMPNIAMHIGQGTSVYCLGNSVRPTDPKLIRNLMGAVGYVEELQDESLMDCVTALSGSGPAYCFMILESLVDGAVMMGMSRAQAMRLAANTLIGAAAMCLKGNYENGSMGSLKGDVCSPGGCTARSVFVLEKMGLRAALIAAVEASTLRSKEIYKESLGRPGYMMDSNDNQSYSSRSSLLDVGEEAENEFKAEAINADGENSLRTRNKEPALLPVYSVPDHFNRA
ncbi:unnamed protein product [Gordionus sp. m RMFG-2023]